METLWLHADSHVIEPLNLRQERLPDQVPPHRAAHGDRVPDRPGVWWFIETDREPHNVILGFGANKTVEELREFLKSFSCAGAQRRG